MVPVVGDVDCGYLDHFGVGLGGEVHFDGSLLSETGPDDHPVCGGCDGVVPGLVVDVAAAGGFFVAGVVFGVFDAFVACFGVAVAHFPGEVGDGCGGGDRVSGLGDGFGDGSPGVGGGVFDPHPVVPADVVVSVG